MTAPAITLPAMTAHGMTQPAPTEPAIAAPPPGPQTLGPQTLGPQTLGAQTPTAPAARSPSRGAALRPGESAQIDRHALWALRTEVRLYPKAGLVSFEDTGSHGDMDAGTFRRSIAALEGYFGRMAEAGAAGASFAELKALGQAAEARMFAATGGINTHRGGVFSLGLLSAAAGRRRLSPCPRGGSERHATGVAQSIAQAICRGVEHWGPDILASARPGEASHGAAVRARYGAPGAREEAAAGYPILCFHALPAFEGAYRASGSLDRAALQAYYATLAALDDNNLLYRAGPEGLAFAQGAAQDFLARGGMLAHDAFRRAGDLHRAFVARRLSPGGAADLLGATLFLALETGMVSPWG